MSTLISPQASPQTDCMSDWIKRGQQTVMHIYKQFPVVFSHGSGCYLWDLNGKRYLDFVAGIAVSTLGYGYPRLTEKLAQQTAKLMHCSNLYWNEPQIELAEMLTQAGGFDKAFFCNSGAEAVEAALKLARKASHEKYGAHRTRVIAMENSFHGRTYGAMSLTGQTKYHAGFSPLVPEIIHVPFNDFDAVQAHLDDSVCAILVEPIQGEGGIRPANVDYLKALRHVCDERDLLLIFDEVQTGIGRTGKLFAFEWSEIAPDIIALAKGLGGGFPIGCMMANAKAASYFQPGDHASTFGGNPMACIAGKTVLETIVEEDLLANVMAQGAYLAQQLTALQTKYPEIILDVRGLNLMQGIELNQPVAPVIDACLERGLLLVGAGPQIIRFVPPLIVPPAQIDEAVQILADVLSVMK